MVVWHSGGALHGLDERSYRTSVPVSTGMGDRSPVLVELPSHRLGI